MVEVDWNAAEPILSLHCQGHAGFDAELDLVCAAVSALTGALGIGFSKVLTLPHRIEVADGTFQLQLTAQPDHPDWKAAQTLLKTTVLALEELIAHYPGFIRRRSGNEGEI